MFQRNLEKNVRNQPVLMYHPASMFFQLVWGTLTVRMLYLTHQVPVLPSYRNQSIELHSKLIDWFLYEGNTGTLWVNVLKKLDSQVKHISVILGNQRKSD